MRTPPHPPPELGTRLRAGLSGVGESAPWSLGRNVGEGFKGGRWRESGWEGGGTGHCVLSKT